MLHRLQNVDRGYVVVPHIHGSLLLKRVEATQTRKSVDLLQTCVSMKGLFA